MLKFDSFAILNNEHAIRGNHVRFLMLQIFLNKTHFMPFRTQYVLYVI